MHYNFLGNLFYHENLSDLILMMKLMIFTIYNFRRFYTVILKSTLFCSIRKLIVKYVYTNRCRGNLSYFSKSLSGRKVDMERLANALLVISVRCIAICAFEGGSHTLLKSRYKFAFGSRQKSVISCVTYSIYTNSQSSRNLQ